MGICFKETLITVTSQVQFHTTIPICRWSPQNDQTPFPTFCSKERDRFCLSGIISFERFPLPGTGRESLPPPPDKRPPYTWPPPMVNPPAGT